MSSLATAYVAIRADIKQLQKDMNEVKDIVKKTSTDVESSFVGMNNALNKTSQIIMSGGVLFGLRSIAVAFYDVGASVIDTSAKIEMLEVKMNRLNPGKGMEVMDYLKRWTADMPISLTKAGDAFTMLSARGLQPTTRIMNIFADTGAVLGQETIPRIAKAFGDMAALGRVASEELNQFSDAGIAVRSMLAEAFGGKTIEQINKAGIAVEDITEAIYKGMEKMYGGMAKQAAGTWDGLTASLDKHVELLKKEVGDSGAFGLAKTMLKDIDDYVVRNTKAVKDWSDGVAILTKSFSDFSETVSKMPLLPGGFSVEGLKSAWGMVGKLVTDVPKQLGLAAGSGKDISTISETYGLTEASAKLKEIEMAQKKIDTLNKVINAQPEVGLKPTSKEIQDKLSAISMLKGQIAEYQKDYSRIIMVSTGPPKPLEPPRNEEAERIKEELKEKRKAALAKEQAEKAEKEADKAQRKKERIMREDAEIRNLISRSEEKQMRIHDDWIKNELSRRNQDYTDAEQTLNKSLREAAGLRETIATKINQVDKDIAQSEGRIPKFFDERQTFVQAGKDVDEYVQKLTDMKSGLEKAREAFKDYNESMKVQFELRRKIADSEAIKTDLEEKKKILLSREGRPGEGKRDTQIAAIDSAIEAQKRGISEYSAELSGIKEKMKGINETKLFEDIEGKVKSIKDFRNQMEAMHLLTPELKKAFDEMLRPNDAMTKREKEYTEMLKDIEDVSTHVIDTMLGDFREGFRELDDILVGAVKSAFARLLTEQIVMPFAKQIMAGIGITAETGGKGGLLGLIGPGSAISSFAGENINNVLPDSMSGMFGKETTVAQFAASGLMLGQAAASAFNSKDQGKQIGTTAGAVLGGAIGAAFANPLLGAALGAQLGNILTPAAKKITKDIDQYFAFGKKAFEFAPIYSPEGIDTGKVSFGMGQYKAKPSELTSILSSKYGFGTIGKDYVKNNAVKEGELIQLEVLDYLNQKFTQIDRQFNISIKDVAGAKDWVMSVEDVGKILNESGVQGLFDKISFEFYKEYGKELAAAIVKSGTLDIFTEDAKNIMIGKIETGGFEEVAQRISDAGKVMKEVSLLGQTDLEKSLSKVRDSFNGLRDSADSLGMVYDAAAIKAAELQEVARTLMGGDLYDMPTVKSVLSKAEYDVKPESKVEERTQWFLTSVDRVRIGMEAAKDAYDSGNTAMAETLLKGVELTKLAYETYDKEIIERVTKAEAAKIKAEEKAAEKEAGAWEKQREKEVAAQEAAIKKADEALAKMNEAIENSSAKISGPIEQINEKWGDIQKSLTDVGFTLDWINSIHPEFGAAWAAEIEEAKSDIGKGIKEFMTPFRDLTAQYGQSDWEKKWNSLVDRYVKAGNELVDRSKYTDFGESSMMDLEAAGRVEFKGLFKEFNDYVASAIQPYEMIVKEAPLDTLGKQINQLTQKYITSWSALDKIAQTEDNAVLFLSAYNEEIKAATDAERKRQAAMDQSYQDVVAKKSMPEGESQRYDVIQKYLRSWTDLAESDQTPERMALMLESGAIELEKADKAIRKASENLDQGYQDIISKSGMTDSDAQRFDLTQKYFRAWGDLAESDQTPERMALMLKAGFVELGNLEEQIKKSREGMLKPIGDEAAKRGMSDLQKTTYDIANRFAETGRQLIKLGVSQEEAAWFVGQYSSALEDATKAARRAVSDILRSSEDILATSGMTDYQKQSYKMAQDYAKRWSDVISSGVGTFSDFMTIYNAWRQEEQKLRVDTAKADLLTSYDTEKKRLQDEHETKLAALNDQIDTMKKRLDEAGEAFDRAGKILDKAFDTEKQRLQDEYEAGLKGMTDKLDITKASLDKFKSSIESISSARKGMTPVGGEQQSYLQASRFLAETLMKSRSGDFSMVESLVEKLPALTGDTTKFYGSAEDYKRDFWKNYSKLAEIEALGSAQLSSDEIIVNKLTEQIDNSKKALDAQLKALDAQKESILGLSIPLMSIASATDLWGQAKAATDKTQLEILQAQLDSENKAYESQVNGIERQITALNNIEKAIKSIPDALSAYTAAKSEPVIISQTLLNRNMSVPTPAMAPASASQSPGGLDWASFINIPAFADGGYHEGGFRLVGERGPEIEYTGPSFVSDASSTRRMLDNRDVVKELKELKELIERGQYVIAKNTAKSAKSLDKWDSDGMPETRTP